MTDELINEAIEVIYFGMHRIEFDPSEFPPPIIEFVGELDANGNLIT